VQEIKSPRKLRLSLAWWAITGRSTRTVDGATRAGTGATGSVDTVPDQQNRRPFHFTILRLGKQQRTGAAIRSFPLSLGELN
jgi:hypothetical protein